VEVEEGVKRVGLQCVALVGPRIAGGRECTFWHQIQSWNAEYGTSGASQNAKIGGFDFPPWQQIDVVLDFAIWSGSFTCILLNQNFLVAFISLEQVIRGQLVLNKGFELGRLTLLMVIIALRRIIVAVISTRADMDKDGARLLGAVLLCR
jgi:hypothetical protein